MIIFHGTKLLNLKDNLPGLLAFLVRGAAEGSLLASLSILPEVKPPVVAADLTTTLIWAPFFSPLY